MSDLRTTVVGAMAGVVAGSIPAYVDYTVREREMDIKLVEIAVGLLKEDPNGPLQPARVWAVDIIDHYSTDVPLGPEAVAALTKCRLDPFYAIGLGLPQNRSATDVPVAPHLSLCADR